MAVACWSSAPLSPILPKVFRPDIVTYEINSIANNIRRPPPVLVGNRDPYKVADALHQRRRGEEIRHPGHRLTKQARVSPGMGAREEVHGDIDHGDGRACRKEVAYHHGDADDCLNFLIVIVSVDYADG